MDKFYIEESFLKNIYVTDAGIMGSDENYETLENFLKKIKNGEKGKLDTHVDILFADIVKIIPYREEYGIQVFYKENKKETKTYFQFGKHADFEEVLQFILSKNSRLKPSVIQTSSFRAIVYPIIYTFFALAITIAVVENAIELENGGSVVVSGGKKGLKNILLTVAETLGVWGSVIAGGLLTLGLALYTFKVYKDSKTEREIFSV